MYPFWVVSVTTEGIHVTWTSTDLRRYWVEIGTVFNVETTTTNNVFRSAGGGDGVGWEDADGSVSDG